MATNLRRRPAVLRALGCEDPPQDLRIDDRRWERIEIFKHDSWAATALYGTDNEKIVVKFNRIQPLFFLPMAWLGRWLASREVRAFRMLEGLSGVPEPCGDVFVGGKRWRNAFAHRFVPGHPLGKQERPGTAFFDELERLLVAMHVRGMAYLDLNKRENVIVSEFGAPVLVDFQIHFAVGRSFESVPPARWLIRQLQAGDLYHLKKLRVYHTDGPEAVSRLPIPWSSRIWRFFYVHPVQWMRRRLLVALRIRSGEGLAMSELEPEKAVRLTRGVTEPFGEASPPKNGTQGT